MVRPNLNKVQTIPRAMLDKIDAYVGGRLRDRRRMLDLSQTYLAEKVGLSFQQFQKYEKGANRISASKLHAFAELIDVPVSYFFDGLNETLDLPPPPPMPEDTLNRREVLELLQAYWAIENTSVRRALFLCVKAIARVERAAEAG